MSPKFKSTTTDNCTSKGDLASSIKGDDAPSIDNNLYYSDLSVAHGYIPAAGIGMANIEFVGHGSVH